MGEAETDPDAPRISPFKFIPRPKLSGADAHTAYDDVQKILDDAREKINEAPAPIQVHILNIQSGPAKVSFFVAFFEKSLLLRDFCIK